MRRQFRCSILLLAVMAGLLLNRAIAQSVTDPDPSVLSDYLPSTVVPNGFSATRWAGPVIYIVDASGRLGTVELATGKVVPLKSLGVLLTDIAFCPNQKLYGVSFTTLYEIIRSPISLRLIGRFGSLNINALTCDQQNNLLAHSNSIAGLYKLNLSTGAATLIGRTGTYRSSGDLVFHEKELLLSSVDKRLVALNRVNGAVQGSVYHGLSNLFGLISIGPNELIGCKETSIYRINRLTGVVTLLGNYVSSGLGACYGAAYNGNFR